MYMVNVAQSNEMQRVLRVLVFSVLSCSSVFCLKITPNETELTFTNGASFTLTCENDHPVQWKYPESESESQEEDYSNKTVENVDGNGLYKSELTVQGSIYMDTGYYTCLSKKEGENIYEEESVYIFVEDENHPLAVRSNAFFLEVNEFGDIVVPCRPTSPDIVPTLRDEQDVLIDNTSFVYDARIGFTKSSPKVTDSGMVICEVNGTRIREFQLHVNPKTKKISRPFINDTNALHPVVGSNVVLHCSVTMEVGDVLFINWKYPDESLKDKVIDGQQSEEKNSNGVVFMNSKTITIPNISVNDAGNYSCIVSDLDRNEMSTSIYLNIYDPNSTFMNMTIQGDMLEWTVSAGEKTFQWVVNVLAFPRPGITWLNPQGVEIPISQSSKKYSATFNGRLAKLIINNIDIHDSGTYKLIAFNINHTREMFPILHVRDKPETKLNIATQLYPYNENVLVECTATAYPLPKMRWYVQACHKYPDCENNPFNLVPVESYVETAIVQHILKSSLIVNASQSITLLCDATNDLGSSNSSVNMLVTDVTDGYSVSVWPHVITVDDDVNLTCGASKYYYKGNISWFFSAVNSSQLIPVDQIGGLSIINKTTEYSYMVQLHIPNAQKNFTGHYICETSFINGTVAPAQSPYIEVQDVMKPTWNYTTNTNRTTHAIKTGKPIKFVCNADGLPKPKISWYKDKVPVLPQPNDNHVSLRNNNSLLYFKFTSPADAGVYTCVAVNKAGNVSLSQILDFIDKPEEHGHLFMYVVFAGGAVLCGMCIFLLVIRIQKDRKLRKELAETGLLNFEAGAVGSLNPELSLEDQADLLPYDRKWEFSREKLTIGKQLGSGEFGVVMKAEANGIIDPNTNTTVAVKMVKQGADSLHIRALASELKIMIHLGRHLNVVNLLGACTRDIYKRELLVIVEYCKYGNLHSYLMKQRNNFINQIDQNDHLDFSIVTQANNRYAAMINNAFTSSPNTTGGFSNSPNTTGATEMTTISVVDTPIGSDGYLVSKDMEPEWRSNYKGDYRNTLVKPVMTTDLVCWSFQIARGMEYLASRRVLHGDLAARNVLLADDNVVKICDFGLAKSMYNNTNYQKRGAERLPVRWMAIESIRDRVFSTQSDVWSFGITMWELFSLSATPYHGVEILEALYHKLAAGYRLESPAYATKEIHGVMMDCWHDQPTLRPSFTELTERLGTLLEEGVRSHYTNLNELYLKMNEDLSAGGVDYLALLNPPEYNRGSEEPRYVNIPCRDPRDSPELEEDVELKPMLPSTENKRTDANPISFSNPSYAPLTRPK